MSRKLTAFTWLCPLRHLNLKLLCVCEVIASHPKTARGNLLDGRVFPVTIWQWMKPCFILTAFATIALAANAVHCNCQRAVCFIRNGTERHRTGCKTLEDVFLWLNFFNRYRLAFPERE